MKIFSTTVLLLTTGFLLAADEPKETAAKKANETISGTWKIISAERDGQPDKTSENAETTFAGDGKLRVKFADGTKAEGTYKLDAGKKPKIIDYTLNYGPNKGKVNEGIYAEEGDTLKICRSDPGKPRPREFATKGDSGRMLFVLKREKAVAAKPPPPTPSVPVFADNNLAAAVRAVLQHTSGEFSDANLANVYFLEASGAHIASLKGLEKCKNLAQLKLTHDEITDLAPLKELTNLQSLDLAGNKISDITPLAGLTRLQYLELSHNQIRNVAPLSSLTSLASLYLTGNQVRDISPLSHLSKLASLSLGNNQIHDISPLANVTGITTLELKDNQIQDITPLTKASELSLLLLQNNKITDLMTLVKAVKADYEGPKRFAPYLRLYTSGNPLSVAARTSQLATLRGYGVRVQD